MSYRHSAPSHALHTAGLYLALLAALCLTACTRPADVPELDTADSLMEQRPDSALALLRRIDTLRLTSRHDRARYAMLLSMALDKNYIDLKDFHVLQRKHEQSPADLSESSGKRKRIQRHPDPSTGLFCTARPKFTTNEL